MSISVVIPTCNRAHLIARSVRSVLAQTIADIEVVVVIDGINDGTREVVEAFCDPRVRVIETGHKVGPSEARNIGFKAARGQYVTLVDDDDEWHSEKLATQLRVIEDRHLTGEFLIATRMLGQFADGRSFVMPDRLYESGEDLSEYLFDRRRFGSAGVVGVPTILMPRSLALRVPFPNDAVMEDWSWLLLCVVRDRVPLIMCPEPLYVYHLDPNAASRNKGIDWRLSLQWARRYRAYITGKAFSGLLCTLTARRAKHQQGMSAFVEIALAMHREGQPRWPHWLTILALAVVPVDFAERLRRWYHARKGAPA